MERSKDGVLISKDGVFGRVHPRFDYYVDSVNGSDSNDGLTAETAFATLGAAQAVLSDGDRVGLARGSFFRETITDASVIAYGTGKMPVIDCSDVADNAAFSKTGGRTNIYEISWGGHEFSGQNGTTKIRGWEDGVPLIRAASLDACDSTPGSYYCDDASPTNPIAWYMHPAGSDDPILNGKKYEIARRKFAIDNTPFAYGIRTRRNGHHDGSTIGRNGCLLKNCLFEDGNVHNAFISGNGSAVDCIFYKGEAYVGSGSSTLLVHYAEDATGKHGRVIRCAFIGNNDKTKGQSAHYSHGNSPDKRFESMTFEDCVFYGVEACGGGGNNLVARRNRYLEIGSLHSGQQSMLLEDLRIDGGQVVDPGAYAPMRVVSDSLAAAGAALTIRGLRATMRSSSGALLWMPNAGNPVVVTIEDSVFAFKNKTGWPFNFITVGSAGSSVQINRTVMFDGSTIVDLASGVTYAGDNNVFYPGTTDATVAGTTYTDIAAWKAATGQDADSITDDPGLADPLGGDFAVTDSGALAIGAGIGGRAPVSYMTIPSDVEIAAM